MKKTVVVELNGRLGNQMFQYAFARSLAIDLDADVCLYESFLRKSRVENRLDCFNLPIGVSSSVEWNSNILHRIGFFIYNQLTKTKSTIEINSIERKYRRLFAFFGLVFVHNDFIKVKTTWFYNNPICCIGYFQSEHFFEKHKKELKREYNFNQVIVSRCNEIAEKIKKSQSICLHIRLGDYLKFVNFQVISLNYYYRAIDLMKQKVPNAKFFVFSDSPEIVKDRFELSNAEIIPTSYSDQESLYLGSLCKHHIMSNSTFSWWMQYLSDNDDQLVIAPKRWHKNKDFCDIYQTNWIVIDN